MLLEGELDSIERVVRKVEQANEAGAPHDGSSNISLRSAASPDLTAVESVRAPRAAGMVDLIQQSPDISASIERLATRALSVQVLDLFS